MTTAGISIPHVLQERTIDKGNMNKKTNKIFTNSQTLFNLKDLVSKLWDLYVHIYYITFFL